MPPFRSNLLIAAIAALVACSQAPSPPPASSTAGGTEASAAAPALAAQDAVEVRAAATAALNAQRLYAPAGDNAIEYFLALRTLKPDDADTELALVELLPYALIASEQAIARNEFAEARRLVALVAAVDAEAPALGRLAGLLETSEAALAARVAAAERAKVEQERLVAMHAEQAAREQAVLAADATAAAVAEARRVAPSTRAPLPASATTGDAPAPIAAATAPAATVAAPATTPAAPPRLVAAPQPRYPPIALRRRIEGDVTVEIAIQGNGSVATVRVVAATPSGLFDEAALAATRLWKFEPTGRTSTTRQLLRFRLPGAEARRG
jgi:protein TonB